MFGPYAAYILPAYAISAAVILGLVVRAIAVQGNLLREIAKFENAGVRRRPGPTNG